MVASLQSIFLSFLRSTAFLATFQTAKLHVALYHFSGDHHGGPFSRIMIDGA
jgi:hypothetical protein